MRLLIAEDEVDLAEALTAFFEKNQFAVDSVHNGFDAYEYGSSGEYDAIILDVMMPKMNGVEVLQKLRAEGIKTPIMMLTAKAETDDRITGFNAGADDYLPKPFEPDELIARVRAMLRRSEDYHPTLLTWGDITLNPDTGVLSCGRESVRLSGREFQVMELFCARPRWFSPLTASWSGYGAGIAMPRSMWCGYTFLICVKRSSLSAAVSPSPPTAAWAICWRKPNDQNPA